MAKLRDIGAAYPSGSLKIFTGESLSYGYVMANMEVYIVPLTVVLLLALFQWRTCGKLEER